MKITSRFLASAIVSILASLAIIVAIFYALQDVKSEMHRSMIYDEALSKAYALNVLHSELREGSNPSALRQFRDVHSSLGGLLGEMLSDHLFEDALIKQIKTDNEQLGALFNKIYATDDSGKQLLSKEWQELLAPQFWINIHQVTDDINRLRNMSHSRVVSTQDKADITVIALLFSLLFANLMISVVSGRKIVRAEVSLRRSEERHRSILQTAMDGYWQLDMQGRLMEVNEAYCRMSGYSAEELLGMGVSALNAIETNDKIVARLQGSIGQVNDRFESRHRRKDGTLFDVELSIQYKPGMGDDNRMVVFLRDITRRKQTEDALLESEATIRNKLKAIVEPEGDISTLELGDIIDTMALQSMLEDFYQLTGLLGAILDVSGKVLVAVGWQDICTKFHRCHPETLKNCIESDTILTKDVTEGKFKVYRCKNNMLDMVTPLIIGGEHVGNVFVGQFFYEDDVPDVELFRAQARKYGFDEAEYLAALDRVPRFTREFAEQGTQFYAKLAGIVSTMSYSMIQQSRLLSELKQSAKSLQESEERLRLSTELANVAVWEYNFHHNSMSRSHNHDHLYGMTWQEHWDLDTSSAATHPDDRASSNAVIANSVAAGGPDGYAFDFRVIYPDESIHWLAVTGQVVKRNAAGQGLIARGCIEDITERKQAEEHVRHLLDEATKSRRILLSVVEDQNLAQHSLLESERRYRTLFESIDEGFCVIEMICDPKGKAVDYRHLEINPAFLKLTGFNEALTKTMREMIPDIEDFWFETYGHVARTGEAIRFENSSAVLQKSINVFAFRIGGDGSKKVGILFRDVTERIRMEAQLRQAQKMEAIGTLTGGIAHDFNNILTAIIGNTTLLKSKMGQDKDPLMRFVDSTIEAAERATALIQGLLAFSRKQVLHPVPVSLNKTITDMVLLFQRVIGEDITLSTEFLQRNINVLFDQSQLEQVIMNLVINSKDAMENGGTISIITEIDEIDDGFIRRHGFGNHGRYACITVRDTGAGMDQVTIERIYEPFFTTKDTGRGTGLGLSTVYGIVKQHNSFIVCNSSLGKGTDFKLYLPITEMECEAVQSDGVSSVGGVESILLVEDDQHVRMMLTEVLQEAGYNVETASEGSEAIEKFKGSQNHLGLIILDVIMPRMNGKEVLTELKKIKPDIKAIFISGYSGDIIHKKGVIEKQVPFLAKPLSPIELLNKVREVMDEP